MKLGYKFLIFLVVLLFALVYTQNVREGATTETGATGPILEKSYAFSKGNKKLSDDISTFIKEYNPNLIVTNNKNTEDKLSTMSLPRLVLYIPTDDFPINSPKYNEIINNIKSKTGLSAIALDTVYKNGKCYI